jgi:hypothetical protein
MIKTQKNQLTPVNTMAIRCSLKNGSVNDMRREPKTNPPALLTVHDVSRILNIHENTVRRWSNQGLLKPIRLGPRGDRRYKLQDISDYLLSLRSGPEPSLK